MSETNAEKARRGYEAALRGELEAIGDLLAPDVPSGRTSAVAEAPAGAPAAMTAAAARARWMRAMPPRCRARRRMRNGTLGAPARPRRSYDVTRRARAP